jgi:hypothetical protein
MAQQVRRAASSQARHEYGCSVGLSYFDGKVGWGELGIESLHWSFDYGAWFSDQ